MKHRAACTPLEGSFSACGMVDYRIVGAAHAYRCGRLEDWLATSIRKAFLDGKGATRSGQGRRQRYYKRHSNVRVQGIHNRIFFWLQGRERRENRRMRYFFPAILTSIILEVRERAGRPTCTAPATGRTHVDYSMGF